MNADMYMVISFIEVDIMLVYHPFEITNKKHANIRSQFSFRNGIRTCNSDPCG